MTSTLRIFARRFLPAPIRKPLGTLLGRIHGDIINPLQGMIFDLSGGQFKADGCVFIIPKDITRRAFRSCFLNNTYEIDERMLVQKLIRSEDSVLELGACLGIVSCITNKRLRDKTRHLAVEANPNCIPALRQNRDLNQCAFAIENCAVSNAAEVTFFLHPEFIVGGTTQNRSPLPVTVTGKSLQNLYNHHGPFSVLIMDIEGSELETLETSKGILRNFRLILVELHDWAIGAERVNRCREILRQSGFEMIERSYITEAWLRSN